MARFFQIKVNPETHLEKEHENEIEINSTDIDPVFCCGGSDGSGSTDGDLETE